ncbi:MAG TPA: AMP-binding protein [Bauldia sp.]|nr:AMP-binding protein [Bauldia sp.]
MAAGAYEALVAGFRWSIPPAFNIAAACLDRWAGEDPSRPALIRYAADGTLTPIGFAELRRITDALAHALKLRGIGARDRVAILLPQSAEALAAHFAAYKLAAIAVPLAALFGEDALRFRLAAAGARAVITDGAGAARIAGIRRDIPDLETVLSVDGAAEGAEDFTAALASHRDPFRAAATGPDDPALMIFTSGTTGPPKGALHGHRVLLGHLPGFAFTHAGIPSAGDRMWTPSDWAWAGGLLNALLPSLYHGVPVVFGPFRPFDPGEAYALMAGAGVRNAFLPPTALKLMAAAPPPRVALNLRTLGAAGESLGREAFEWSKRVLGIPVDEFYGQTECNYVLGSSAAAGVSRAGAIGRPIPGHDVRVVNAAGMEAATDEPGEIMVRRPDPVMFLGYWRDPHASAAKFSGEWLRTGDQAVRDADGYVRFLGRDDDIIISAGYRIGPAEVEDCLAAHPAVAMAAAVGKPHPVRTEIVKAYVVVRPGFDATPALAEELRLFVRARLSAAEYPREVAFVEALPMTTTGKVIRRALKERAAAEK